MAQDTDHDLNAGADPQRRADGRRWAREALARAQDAFDPDARNRTLAELGLPPRTAQ